MSDESRCRHGLTRDEYMRIAPPAPGHAPCIVHDGINHYDDCQELAELDSQAAALAEEVNHLTAQVAKQSELAERMDDRVQELTAQLGAAQEALAYVVKVNTADDRRSCLKCRGEIGNHGPGCNVGKCQDALAAMTPEKRTIKSFHDPDNCERCGTRGAADGRIRTIAAALRELVVLVEQGPGLTGTLVGLCAVRARRALSPARAAWVEAAVAWCEHRITENHAVPCERCGEFGFDYRAAKREMEEEQ